VIVAPRDSRSCGRAPDYDRSVDRRLANAELVSDPRRDGARAHLRALAGKFPDSYVEAAASRREGGR